MHRTIALLRKLAGLLILIVAGAIPGSALIQSDQQKDKAPSQEKKSDEKKPEANVKGGIEILSDTMGVDFGAYMKRLRYRIQNHWDVLIPPVALPPVNKSGTVTIELAIMRDGRVRGMKLINSSGSVALDQAAWHGITEAVPLPTLPLEFKGDYLQLRCNFVYNPPAEQPQEAKQETKQDPKK
ncbi:MAG TPA: TonB family protein [Candidatus Angelobacter sp.]|jgi:TonB family protein|nr:TonB family protein [Candidatus Angelobacter sp.]